MIKIFLLSILSTFIFCTSTIDMNSDIVTGKEQSSFEGKCLYTISISKNLNDKYFYEDKYFYADCDAYEIGDSLNKYIRMVK